MRTFFANLLQWFYEANRVPETWGSPSVSRQTFAILSEQGFWSALRYLFGRLRTVGSTRHTPMTKFFALAAGVILVAMVNLLARRLFGEEHPEVTRYEKRTFSVHVPKGLIALYALGAGLLVLANGEGEDVPRSGGYPDDPDQPELDARTPMGYHDKGQGYYNTDDYSTEYNPDEYDNSNS